MARSSTRPWFAFGFFGSLTAGSLTAIGANPVLFCESSFA